jgi:hypothetical protein
MPTKPSKKSVTVSFLWNGENRFRWSTTKHKKMTLAINNRRIARFTGESSRRPTMINGKAHAQNTTGRPMATKKYFSMNVEGLAIDPLPESPLFFAMIYHLFLILKQSLVDKRFVLYFF